MQKFLANLTCFFLGACLAEGQPAYPRLASLGAAEESASTDAAEQMAYPAGEANLQSGREAARATDLATIVQLLGKHIGERRVRDSFALLNRGEEPSVRIDGDALVGESRAYFFPAAGVVVHSIGYSGTGQRIGIVTLIGSARQVYQDGREYAFRVFRGPLPLQLNWGQSRADVLRGLGRPVLSNEGISLSDRPKSVIRETRDADEFQWGSVIVRLIHTDFGHLDEIDLQRTIRPAQP